MSKQSKTQDNRDAEVARRVLRHWHEAVPNDRMAHLIRDTRRAFQRSLQARLAEHGVTHGHWAFLRVLWQRDGLTKHELSIEAGVMEPTTVNALRTMEAQGYVSLQRRPDNRKNIYVWLTPLGRELERRLVPLAEDVNATALAGLSAAAEATTRRALLRMIDNLAQDPVLGPPDTTAMTRK